MTDLLKTPNAWPTILLARAGAGDPLDLDAAVAAGAFDGLKVAIRDLGATATVATIGASGLRGRGGAGFPAVTKWRTAVDTDAPRRYVVANGYGADPASHTDRTLMTLDPYAVIEGTAIAAFAIGASEAFIAVRAEDTALIAGLEAAIGAATDAGFLGDDIWGSGHDVTITVRPVQGAYMLGEETVLLKALEGKRGQPEQRPPHPAARGLHGMPTVVHNVQTLASVAWILANGSDAFRATGTHDAPGTILVQLRAPDVLDTPYSFETLRIAGAHLGSGSVVAVDDSTDLLELIGVLTRFCSTEACGKSIPCRIGTKRLAEIVDRRERGLARPSDDGLAADLAHDIVASALCDHERLATLPLTSGMRYFESDLRDARRSEPAPIEAP
jgi:NADH:ubiquinone oxidoreductase subunit F (NADH-binding)